MAKKYQVTEVNGVEVVGEGVGFERIRRITGYLVGTLDRTMANVLKNMTE